MAHNAANGPIDIEWIWSGATRAPDETLDQMKDRVARRIDADAEGERLRHITPGDGQQMVYREKFEQAQGVHGLGEQAASALTSDQARAQFPTLAASVGIEAPTLWACAQLVLTRYAAFADRSYDIERARLSGKAAVSAASTPQDVNAAYEAITWPSMT